MELKISPEKIIEKYHLERSDAATSFIEEVVGIGTQYDGFDKIFSHFRGHIKCNGLLIRKTERSKRNNDDNDIYDIYGLISGSYRVVGKENRGWYVVRLNRGERKSQI